MQPVFLCFILGLKSKAAYAWGDVNRELGGGEWVRGGRLAPLCSTSKCPPNPPEPPAYLLFAWNRTRDGVRLKHLLLYSE